MGERATAQPHKLKRATNAKTETHFAKRTPTIILNIVSTMTETRGSSTQMDAMVAGNPVACVNDGFVM